MENQIPNRIYFNSSISKFEKVKNTGFLLGRARIAYAGENRNGSYISRETFDSALDSLSLIPVVGNWIPEKDNFGGHDFTIEGEGNALHLIEKTRPYGVVMENHNAEWVDVEDEEGNIKKYLECDVVLWEEKYQKPIKRVVDGGVNQSMEIVPTQASFNNNTGLYDIDSFYYSALCLLGRDEENPENNIEPCFEDSQITAYHLNLDKEEFKSEFNSMMGELKNYFEGGEQVKDNLEQEVVEITEEVVVEEVFEEEISEELVDEATDEFEEEATDEEEITLDTLDEDIPTEEKFTKLFELSHDDIRSKLYGLLYKVEEEDDEWYWINEVYDDYFVYSSDWNPKYYKQGYIKTDVDVALEGERVQLFVEYLTTEELEELNKIRANYNLILTENEELKEFKVTKEKEEFDVKQEELKQEKINHINSEYGHISEDIKELFISKVDEYETTNDIDADICVYIVKNKVTFSKTKKEPTTVKVNVDEDVKNLVASPYGDLF